MRYSFLSGGTGTPKLLQGFRQHLDDKEIGVVCNTGDDYQWFGLHISPDLDTVLYLFSRKLDIHKFWGREGESFKALNTLRSLGEDTWFNVGDKDLGLHLFRTQQMRSNGLTVITEKITNQWEIDATILPMADSPVQSIIYTEIGKLQFQEYFVRHRWQPKVEHVEYEGDKGQLHPALKQLVVSSRNIIIGPSNPITSIGPMLSLFNFKDLLVDNKGKITAISPLVGNSVYSGPTANLMQAMNIEVSVTGLAEHYCDVISKLVIDPADAHFTEEIEDFGIEVIELPIELKTKIQKSNLAKDLLELL